MTEEVIPKPAVDAAPKLTNVDTIMRRDAASLCFGSRHNSGVSMKQQLVRKRKVKRVGDTVSTHIGDDKFEPHNDFKVKN